MLTAGYDPLRDEGRAYADRLIDAGVKTTYVNYPGTIHGFFSLTRFLSQGLKANDEAAAVCCSAWFGRSCLRLKADDCTGMPKVRRAVPDMKLLLMRLPGLGICFRKILRSKPGSAPNSIPFSVR